MEKSLNLVPFISVLIPTKNRAHLVGYAIQSVLDQGFEDFEIILVDNDDGDETGEVVRGFSDSRLKYFKTGGLNMSENWEFALEQARGKYVTVLEDKQAYYPWALERLFEILTGNRLDVMIWEWDHYDDHEHKASRPERDRSFEELKSDDVLNLYINNRAATWKFLPRMLNSCASLDIIRSIKSHNKVRRFFEELSPDLCAAFHLLAHVDTLGVLNDGLGLVGYVHLSNARKNVSDRKVGERYYGKANISEEAVRYVPIKANKLVHNTVYNEFLRIRRELGGRLSRFEMSPVVYARLCLRDVAHNFHHGVPRFEDLKPIASYCKRAQMPAIEMAGLAIYFVAEIVKPYMRRLLRFRSTEQVWQAENIHLAVREFQQAENAGL